MEADEEAMPGKKLKKKTFVRCPVRSGRGCPVVSCVSVAHEDGIKLTQKHSEKIYDEAPGLHVFE